MPRAKPNVKIGDVRQNKNGKTYLVVGLDGKQCFIQPMCGQNNIPMRLLKEIVKRWKLIETREAA